MKKISIALLLLSTYVIFDPHPTLAASADTSSATEEIMLGYITNYTGQVLVRSRGEWGKLSEMPFALYNTDKIVTKRGRAEIGFVDGGNLKMDIDTTISLVEIREKAQGLIGKKTVTRRQVNVLVGKTVFEVKIEKDQPPLDVRTPTMTAAIKGSTLNVDVNDDGATDFNKQGDVDTKGGNRDDNLAGAPTFDPEDLKNAERSPERAQHPALKSAEIAVNRALEAANKQTKAADAGSMADTLQLQILAATQKANAAKDSALASVAAAEDALLEAQILNDEPAQKAAQPTVDLAQSSADKAAAAADNAADIAKEAASSQSAVQTTASHAAVRASSAAAQASADTADAASTASSQAGVGDISGSQETSIMAARTMENAERALGAARATYDLAKQVAGANSNSEARILAAAARAHSSVAVAAAAAAAAGANHAMALVTGADNDALKAKEAAAGAEENAGKAQNLANDTMIHAQTAAAAQTETEAEDAAQAAEASASLAESQAATAQTTTSGLTGTKIKPEKTPEQMIPNRADRTSAPAVEQIGMNGAGPDELPDADTIAPKELIIIKGKKPADYDHTMHNKAGITCGECHHNNEGLGMSADEIGLNAGHLTCVGCHNGSFRVEELRQLEDIFHAQCRDCHMSWLDSKKGPPQCADCHITERGATEKKSADLDAIQEETDSNTCLGCHNHMEFYQKLIKKKSVHMPVLNIQCKRCHALKNEDKNQEGIVTDADQKNKPADDNIKWVGRNYRPETVHWFSVPSAKIGPELIIFGGQEGQDNFQANVRVPDFSKLKQLPEDTTPPLINNVQLVEVRHGIFLSVTIEWTTDEYSDSQIFFGLDQPEQKTHLDAQMLTRHRITITDLQTARDYRYYVVSRDISGNVSQSGILTFSTANQFVREDNGQVAQPGQARFDSPLPAPPLLVKDAQAVNGNNIKLKKEFFKLHDNYVFKLTVSQPLTLFIATKIPPPVKKGTVTKWTMDDRLKTNENLPEAHWVLEDKFYTGYGLCLSCHTDYHLKTIHPLRVPLPEGYSQPDDFPLLPDGRIACFSCHEPHASDFGSLSRREEKALLCVGCHADKIGTVPADYSIH